MKEITLHSAYGYLTLYDDSEANKGVVAVVQVNSCPSDKAELHMKLSIERARRLCRNKHCLSSHGTCSDPVELRLGAVRTNIGILSFDGFAGDKKSEALAVYVAVKGGIMSGNIAASIAHASSNDNIKANFFGPTATA